VENKTNWVAVILGAGRGKRMNSDLPKIAHQLKGRPLVSWVFQALVDSGIQRFVLVVSPEHHDFLKMLIQKEAFSSKIEIVFAIQEQPLGTAHAVACGVNEFKRLHPFCEKDKLNMLVAYGDTPAVQTETFSRFMGFHQKQGNDLTILAFKSLNPFGYGRVIQGQGGEFLRICEEKDCSEEERKIDLCNSGLLCCRLDLFLALWPSVSNQNAQKEYYLTDIPLLAKELGCQVGILSSDHQKEFLGVNTQEQLVALEKALCVE